MRRKRRSATAEALRSLRVRTPPSGRRTAPPPCATSGTSLTARPRCGAGREPPTPHPSFRIRNPSSIEQAPAQAGRLWVGQGQRATGALSPRDGVAALEELGAGRDDLGPRSRADLARLFRFNQTHQWREGEVAWRAAGHIGPPSALITLTISLCTGPFLPAGPANSSTPTSASAQTGPRLLSCHRPWRVLAGLQAGWISHRLCAAGGPVIVRRTLRPRPKSPPRERSGTAHATAQIATISAIAQLAAIGADIHASDADCQVRIAPGADVQPCAERCLRAHFTITA